MKPRSKMPTQKLKLIYDMLTNDGWKMPNTPFVDFFKTVKGVSFVLEFGKPIKLITIHFGHLRNVAMTFKSEKEFIEWYENDGCFEEYNLK